MGFLKLLKVNGGFQDTLNVSRNHVIALMFLRFCIHGGRLLLGPVDTGCATPEQPCDRASGGSTVRHLLIGTVVLAMAVESRHASNIVTGNLARGNLSSTGNSGVDPLRLCLGRGKTSSSVFLAKCQPALGVGDSGSRGFV